MEPPAQGLLGLFSRQLKARPTAKRREVPRARFVTHIFLKLLSASAVFLHRRQVQIRLRSPCNVCRAVDRRPVLSTRNAPGGEATPVSRCRGESIRRPDPRRVRRVFERVIFTRACLRFASRDLFAIASMRRKKRSSSCVSDSVGFHASGASDQGSSRWARWEAPRQPQTFLAMSSTSRLRFPRTGRTSKIHSCATPARRPLCSRHLERPFEPAWRCSWRSGSRRVVALRWSALTLVITTTRSAATMATA